MNNQELSQRIAHLSEEMRDVAIEMMNSDNEKIIDAGNQLFGAANVAESWVKSIEEMNND